MAREIPMSKKIRTQDHPITEKHMFFAQSEHYFVEINVVNEHYGLNLVFYSNL